MNDDEFSERPSGFMLGKEFIIVLVIIFSGLSFTLGYFVGKSGAPKTEPVMQAIEPPVQAKNQDLPPLPQQTTAVPAPEQTQPAPPPVKGQVVPGAPAAAKPLQQLPIKETAPGEVKKNSEQKNPASLQQKSVEPPAAKSASEKSAGKAEPAASPETNKTVYAVQLGAFSNSAEAKRLKAKFDKKGYKCVITTSRNKKAQKIFKVKTGEFREKKDAEVLALKLKKTEGLQTYVTLRTE